LTVTNTKPNTEVPIMNYEDLKYAWSEGEFTDEEFFNKATEMGFDLEVERDLSIYLTNLETTIVPELPS
jgi:hypothetical protein